MKVLQLIDSLHPGGAERMAVTLANVLATKIEKSYICVTREEGLLKNSILDSVGYLLLNKKSIIDIKAIKKLNTFIKEEKITIIHAHSSSFFLGTLVRFLNKKVKLIWHDHFGNRKNSAKIDNIVLKQCSKYFSHIFCASENLESWAKSYLHTSNVSYLPNFVAIGNVEVKTKLLGVKNKRIICLANLRPDKDHLNALTAFQLINKKYPEWTLHLIGKDFNDVYSKSVFGKIKKLELENKIFFYNSISDVTNVLKQSTIGLLSSLSEGLPMALLEYGLAGLPVVVTDVGNCATVVLNGDLGQLVPAKDSYSLSEAIINYIEDYKFRDRMASEFKAHIVKNYSENNIEFIEQTYLKILI